ncbi:hypothetical protein [Burkholderia ubonensis]|uniref:hypothetical protein n=1 Tax=Burkholderia ubonensis TaxID=101571 RepID=UPI001178705C|nr:hypothetical protein [Burkholderia ubonensis]
MQGSESEGRGRSTDGVLTRAIEALKDYPYFVFPLAIAVLAVTAGGVWGQLGLAIALLLFAVVVLVVVLGLSHRISGRERKFGLPPRSPSTAETLDETQYAFVAVSRPTNLGFEETDPGTWPSGWFDSAGYVDGVSTAFKAQVVERRGGAGNCVHFQNPLAGSDEFGSLMQRIPARRLAGKMIRLECEISTKRVQQWAGMWLRADNSDGYSVFFDNMSGRPIRGSIGWTRYNIDTIIPLEAEWLNFGIVLVGRGEMWADNFRLLEAVGSAWKDVSMR